jgi:hypothetical protein
MTIVIPDLSGGAIVLFAAAFLILAAWWWIEHRAVRRLEEENRQLLADNAALWAQPREIVVIGEPGLGRPPVPPRPQGWLPCGCRFDQYVRRHRPGFCPFNAGCDCGSDPRAHRPDTPLLRPPVDDDGMTHHGWAEP